jgi:hypothetical protein
MFAALESKGGSEGRPIARACSLRRSNSASVSSSPLLSQLFLSQKLAEAMSRSPGDSQQVGGSCLVCLFVFVDV